MSLPVRAAVRTALLSSSTLDSLLARDPDNIFLPAVFHGTVNDQAPLYPCVTFRVTNETPDARFAPVQAAGGGPSKIRDIEIEVECWDNRQDQTVPIERIADAVELPLDGKALVLTSSPSGWIFQISLSMRSGPFWDPANKCWFILLRFRARVQFF